MPPSPIPLLLLAFSASPYRQDLEAGRYLLVLAAAEIRLKADPNDALAWAAKSQALTALQRFGEALAAAQRALALAPELGEAFQAKGLARAGIAVQARNFSSIRNALGALDDLELATRKDPNLAVAWMTLGLAYQALPGLVGGSTRKALACAEGLRRVQPARGDALQGWILSDVDRWPEALPFFGRALALAPGDPEVVYTYLEALGSKATRKRLGEAEQRQRLAAEARRLLPAVQARARGIEAITDALLDAGQHEEAWQVAKAALSQVDAPSLVRLQLGKLAARTNGHKEEGLACLDQVVREPLEGGSGGYPAAHWRRGQILKDLGRLAESRAAAQQALKLDPAHPGAKRLLE